MGDDPEITKRDVRYTENYPIPHREMGGFPACLLNRFGLETSQSYDVPVVVSLLLFRIGATAFMQQNSFRNSFMYSLLSLLVTRM